MHPVNFNFGSFKEIYSNRDYFIKYHPELWEGFFNTCYKQDEWKTVNATIDDVFFHLINKDLVNSCICSTPGLGYAGIHRYSYSRCNKSKTCWRCSSAEAWKARERIHFQPELYFVTLNSPRTVRIRDYSELSEASAVIYPELIKSVTNAARNSINGGAWIAKEIACVSIKQKLFNPHIHAIFKGDVSLLNISNARGREPINSIAHLNRCIRYVHKPLQNTILHKYRLCYNPSWGRECNIKTQEIIQTLIEGTHGVRKFTTVGSLRRSPC